jgi:3-dehydroquinate dehydratase
VRRESLLAARAAGVIAGLGPDSYLLGLRALVRIVRAEAATRPTAGENDLKE